MGCLGGVGELHCAGGVVRAGRVGNRLWRGAGAGAVGQEGGGLPVLGGGGHFVGQGDQGRFIGKVEAGGIVSAGAEQGRGTSDGGVRGSDRQAALRGQVARCLHRVGDQGVQRDGAVADLVDEGGIGAVFQQAAHQIGQQRLVRADGGVDAAGAVEMLCTHDVVVEPFAHAVQALEFIFPVLEIGAGQGVDGGDRAGVVGGELREDRIGRVQQQARAGNIADVGMGFAGVDGKIGLAVELGFLDFAVPVSALDQTDHDAAAGGAR